MSETGGRGGLACPRSPGEMESIGGVTARFANSFIDAWYYCCVLWNNFLGNRVSDKSLKLSAWKSVPVWLRKAVVDSHVLPLEVNGGVPGC